MTFTERVINAIIFIYAWLVIISALHFLFTTITGIIRIEGGY